MTLAEVLASLFPSSHTVEGGPSGVLHRTAKLKGRGEVAVVGIVGGTQLCVDGAIMLAGHVLAAVEASAARRSSFSSMPRARTWLLGLNAPRGLGIGQSAL